jgi:PAS domain S-box-containing protein
VSTVFDSTSYILIFTIVAYLFVGIIVITNNPRAAANRIMLSFCLVASFWALAILIISMQDSPGMTLFWIRASHVLGVVAPWHILALVTSLFDKKPLSTRGLRVSLVASFLMACIAFSPLFIIGLEEPYLENRIIYGVFTYPFIIFIIGMITFTLWQVFSRLKNSRGKTRIQMNYLFTGTLISALLITAVNIILPLIGIIYIHDVDIRSLGPLFSLIMLGSISYAIVKHRFMDLRLALRKNLTSLIIAFLLAVISMLVVRIMYQWVTVYDDLIKEIIIAVIVFFVIVMLPAIKDRIQFLIDKFIYKGVADYHTLLIESTKKISNLMDVELLLDNLTKNIVRFLKPEYSFYCLLDDSNDPKIQGFIEISEEHNELFIDKTLIKLIIDYLGEDLSILVQADSLGRANNPAYEPLYIHMKKIGVDLVMPLVSDGYLEGLLFLGAKDTGEPYYHEDILLLSEISTQVKIGLINAKHYKEIANIKLYQERILSEMGNGLIAVNDRGYITVCNSEAIKLLGLSNQDVVGTGLLNTFGEELNHLYEQTLSKNNNLSQHEICLKKNEKTKFISCNTTLIQTPDRSFKEVIIVLSNITRIKELESERIKSQRLISLGEVAAGIAHEIKNPLVSIKTFADLLPEKYEDDDFRNKFSKVVSQEITRINDLVGELLNFVKEPVLNYEQVYIEGLIEEVISLLSPQMEAQSIVIELELPALREPVSVDRPLLKQALLNIFLNSVQAMPNGGRMIAGVCNSDLELTIFIEDTGIGIADSIREKIFDPFVTNKADGVGLGLSICHKIISAHRGRIIVKSDEDRGSRFEIVLPSA